MVVVCRSECQHLRRVHSESGPLLLTYSQLRHPLQNSYAPAFALYSGLLDAHCHETALHAVFCTLTIVVPELEPEFVKKKTEEDSSSQSHTVLRVDCMI